MGRKAPRRCLACRVKCRPTGVRAPVRLSALRHPSIRVSEAEKQTPGAKNAPRERDGLFDIVSRAGESASSMLACGEDGDLRGRGAAASLLPMKKGNPLGRGQSQCRKCLVPVNTMAMP